MLFTINVYIYGASNKVERLNLFISPNNIEIVNVLIFCCHSGYKKMFMSLQIKDRYDILPHIYEKFDKSKIAKLCKELATCKCCLSYCL